MKGIILAGGSGSRLYPLTLAVSKQLLPVFDKPMIYYPLSLMMLAGIRELLVISTPAELPRFELLMGDGRELGLTLRYAAQPQPLGLADAFRIARDFVGADPVALVLGDNLFHGAGLAEHCRAAIERPSGATIFCARVDDPARYGVVEFDPATERPIRIEEKPQLPRSEWAVTGLYFYDNRVIDIAAGLSPSARGELEITDVNRWYLERGELTAVRLNPEFAWFDTGEPDSLHEAAAFVRAMQARLGLRIMCPETIALDLGYVEASVLRRRAMRLAASEYGADILRRLDARVDG